MESIEQLRLICQSSRPSIFGDFLSQFYYKVSIYFTWCCLFIGMNANQVTVLSVIFALLGGVLISSDSHLLIFLGAIFFHVFAILDMSDGEVARYRGEGGVQGHYLDWFMHFITPTALAMGLFVSSYERLDSEWLVILGLIAVVSPVLSKSIQNAGWTVISWTYMRDKKSNKINISDMKQKSKSAELLQQKSLPKFFRRIKFILLIPFEDRWSTLLILFLSIIGLAFSFLNIDFFNYRYIWLIYMGFIGPIYIIINVYKITHSAALYDGYLRISDKDREISFPEDDFLG